MSTSSSPGRKTARRPKPAPARPYHHGNLRATLLATAEALLAEHGAQGLTLREVARVAGVSHAAPYHHFAALDDLLAAVAQRGFEALEAAMAEAVSVTDSRERLLRVNEAYVRCAMSHPQRFRLMFGPLLSAKEQHPGLQQAAAASFQHVLQASLAHDREHGAHLAVAGWSLAHGLSHLLIDGALDGIPIEQREPAVLARTLADKLLR